MIIKHKLIAVCCAVFGMLSALGALIADSPSPANNARTVKALPTLRWSVAGENILTNGGFEQGFAYWSVAGSNISTLPPVEGTNALKFTRASYTIALPPSNTPIIWSYQLYNYLEGYLTAEVRRPDRQQPLWIQKVEIDGFVDGWRSYFVDLSAFQGQTIVLSLSSARFDGVQSYGYLDDVRVTVLPPDVQFDLHFGSPEQFVRRITNPFVTLDQRLDPAHTYSWRVDTIEAGVTNVGPVWQFSTGHGGTEVSIEIPDLPQLVCPSVGVPLEYYFLNDFGFRVTNTQNKINLIAVADDARDSSIVISEVSLGGFSGGTITPQAVELINSSSNVTNIKGWRIELYDGGNYYQYPQIIGLPEREVAPGEIFTLFDRDTANIWPSLRMRPCGWGNGSFGILIRDASNNIVDCIEGGNNGARLKVAEQDWRSYTTNAPVAPKSFQRVGNRDLNVIEDWIVATNTLGELNVALQMPFARGFGKLPATFFTLGGFVPKTELRIPIPAKNAQVWARSTSPVVSGRSDTFQVVDSSLCISFELPTTIREDDRSVPVHIVLGAVASTDVLVTLHSSHPDIFDVASSATILAGSSEATVEATIANNDLLEGAKKVWLTAEAEGYATRTIDVVVHDDEIATLTVTAPPIIREGEPNEIVIESSAAPVTNVIVKVTTDVPTIGPYGTTLRAGTNKISLTIVDDNFAQCNRTVHLRAEYDNWPAASAQFEFIDNDATLMLIPYDLELFSIAEGYSLQGQIKLGGSVVADLPVSLTSARPDLLNVQGTVIVRKYASTVSFWYTVPENSLPPGLQTVELTASAEGFPTAKAMVDVQLYPPVPKLNAQITEDGVSLRVTFQAEAGYRYFLHSNSSLDIPWQIASVAEAQVIDSVGQFTAPLSSETRFYRLTQFRQ